MTKKNKQIYSGAGALVLLIAIIWVVKSAYHVPQTQVKNSTNQPSQQNTNQGQNPSSSKNIWTGTLKKSDTAAKGNLMLVTADHTVYIHTGRDYSALVGKQVSVSYKGDLNSFTLLDISAK